MASKLAYASAAGAALIALSLAAPPGALLKHADVGPMRVAALAKAPEPSPGAASAAAYGNIDPLATAAIAKAEPERPKPIARIAPPAPELAPLELQRFSAAAQAYRKGALAVGDAIAAKIDDAAERATLEWLAIRSQAAPDSARLAAFGRAHPNWPDNGWVGGTEEASLYTRHAPAAEIDATFAKKPPQTAAGLLALARAALAEGKATQARDSVSKLWRERDLDPWTEGAVLREFGGLLTRADHKARADRLLYAEKGQAAMRAAALAGADVVALARARLEAAVGPLSARTLALVPPNLQADPGLLFARIQDARRTNRVADATALFSQAPRDATSLVDPDKWWTERRMVAREWLEKGDYEKAYALCVEATTVSSPARVDAGFHAGWIALTFLKDAARAIQPLDAAVAAAETPISIARAQYWRGRAAEALGDKKGADVYYANAAAYPIAYYGQLAGRRLGRAAPAAPRAPYDVAVGNERWLPTRAAELYFAVGLDDAAITLAYAAAQAWKDEPQLAALGDVVAKHASAAVSVTFGKIATERGYALDSVAFPLGGAPAFAALPKSADQASVLGVARQESEFLWRAASGAGAKGLMQILPGTAYSTARRAGLAYDYGRLIGDPAYNLQLGAAYLGQLFEDEGGSTEMTLAAYNAGAGRVAQWTAAFGDPRTGGIDPVDWVERIPYDETRDYVERVSENIAVYRARLAEAGEGAAAKVARQ